MEDCIDNTLYITWYAIFDTETQKCIQIIQELNGYEEQKVEEEYSSLTKDWKELMKPRIEDNKIYTNINNYNGKTREEIKNSFKNSYEVI